jgi:hypothetical protein
MNRTAFDEQDEKPLDPAMERVRRKMVRLLAVSIGIMMTGLMAVLIAVVYKVASQPPKPAGATPTSAVQPSGDGVANGDIVLPPGTRIVSQSVSGSQLSLLTQATDGAQTLMVYDMNARRFIAKFTVTQGGD